MAIVEEPPSTAPGTVLSAPVVLAHGRARLVLRHPSRVGGWVDGGWWPYTFDLAEELRPLIHAMHRAGFDASAVTYQLPAWPGAPRELIVRGRPVRLRGYRTQEPDSITLTDRFGWDGIDLLVVPPAAGLAVADCALLLAGGADLRRAHEILRQAYTAASYHGPTSCVGPRPPGVLGSPPHAVA